MLYLSGSLRAIGFRMNLFNIGVDGQYRDRGVTARRPVAGEASGLRQLLSTVLAILVRDGRRRAWAGIAGVLRVTRGVSEVISTIMLNAIATALVALPAAPGASGSGQQRHRHQEDPGEQPDPQHLRSVAVGRGDLRLRDHRDPGRVLYWFISTRPGSASMPRRDRSRRRQPRPGGIKVTRMIIFAMLISGAVTTAPQPGLVDSDLSSWRGYNYGSFQSGLGCRRHRDHCHLAQPPGRWRSVPCCLPSLSEQSNQPKVRSVSPDIIGDLRRASSQSPPLVISYEGRARAGVRLGGTIGGGGWTKKSAPTVRRRWHGRPLPRPAF